MIRVFRHYIPRWLLLMGASEFLLLVGAAFLGLLASQHQGGSNAGLPPGPLLPRALGIGAVMVLAMTAMGLYQRGLRDTFSQIQLRLGLSGVLGLGLVTLLAAAFPGLFPIRGVFPTVLAGGLVGIALCRLAFDRATRMGELRQRLLVLGAGPCAERLANLRRQADWRGLQLVGFVPLPDQPIKIPRQRLLSATRTLEQLRREHRIDQVVVAAEGAAQAQQLQRCQELGLTATGAREFIEQFTGRLLQQGCDPATLGLPRGLFSRAAKRAFDLLAGLTLGLLAAPVVALAALAVHLDSPGAVFYRQQRVGRHGRRFVMWKLRSMVQDAEDGDPRWASQHDQRVTSVGRILRELRLDELPQLYNVLRGEMSLVGPRPERPEFVQQLSRRLPPYQLRHQVKPGITGWAQICYPYAAGEDAARDKLEFDLYYLKNHGLLFDLMIMIQTVQVVLWRKGAR